MARKKLNKNNKYLNAYSLGGWMSNVNRSIDTSKLGSALGGSAGVSGIAGATASLANTFINPNGNSSIAGNTLQGIGSVASNIPGIGGIIGAGVNLAGGLINAAFGSKFNEEFIKQTENNIDSQFGYSSSATDNASLLSEWGNYKDLNKVTEDQVGTDGWFVNRVGKKTKQLNEKINSANLRAWNSLSNTAGNIDTQNDLMLLANYSSKGGPIHIKKKNRGKFTEYCGGKVTSECIAKGKRSSNPTTRKRATFAANARKWKHDNGGPLNPYSAGALVDAIYKSSRGEEYLGTPLHNYDFTISEEEANRLGYFPNSRGHRDDRVKKPSHPTHTSRGKWNSFEEFELTDKGMENPNYTLFGLNDGEPGKKQDPQAVMTYKGGVVLPEITITPKESYIMNPYDNIKIFDKGGYLINKNSSSRKFNNNYKEGEIYDVTEEEVKILKELGYEFEYV